MKIDVFTHFLPKRYAERFERLGPTPAAANIRKRVAGIPAIADLDLRLRQLEEFGDDYHEVLSIPAPPLEATRRSRSPGGRTPAPRSTCPDPGSAPGWPSAG